METASKFNTYDYAFTFSPALAKETSLNEAIFLRQLEYWMGNIKSGKVKDGQKWVRDTAKEWHEQFIFFSVATINRIIDKLIKKGLLKVRKDLNRHNYDRTKWYTPNFENINKLFDKSKYTIDLKGGHHDYSYVNIKSSCLIAFYQSDKLHFINLSNTIPKTSSKKRYYSQPAKKKQDDSVIKKAKGVIDYLNQHANKHFRYSKSSLRPIKARLKEGFNNKDFKKVMDIKIKQWMDDRMMNQYLRPKTLFNASNFESYLQTPSDSVSNIASHGTFNDNKGNSSEHGKEVNTDDVNKEYDDNMNDVLNMLDKKGQ